MPRATRTTPTWLSWPDQKRASPFVTRAMAAASPSPVLDRRRPAWPTRRAPVLAMTNTPRTTVMTTQPFLVTVTAVSSPAMRPATSGPRIRFQTSWGVAPPHGVTGPMPTRSRSRNERGTESRLKKGPLTPTRVPVTASRMIGNIVPIRTTKAKTVRSRLLARKVPSRETMFSTRGAEASRCPRCANRVKEPTRTRTRKPSSVGPMALCVKEWTEAMVPDRVMKVARMVRAKAEMTRTKFQAWSIPHPVGDHRLGPLLHAERHRADAARLPRPGPRGLLHPVRTARASAGLGAPGREHGLPGRDLPRQQPAPHRLRFRGPDRDDVPDHPRGGHGDPGRCEGALLQPVLRAPFVPAPAPVRHRPGDPVGRGDAPARLEADPRSARRRPHRRAAHRRDRNQERLGGHHRRSRCVRHRQHRRPPGRPGRPAPIQDRRGAGGGHRPGDEG